MENSLKIVKNSYKLKLIGFDNYNYQMMLNHHSNILSNLDNNLFNDSTDDLTATNTYNIHWIFIFLHIDFYHTSGFVNFCLLSIFIFYLICWNYPSSLFINYESSTEINRPKRFSYLKYDFYLLIFLKQYKKGLEKWPEICRVNFFL